MDTNETTATKRQIGIPYFYAQEQEPFGSICPECGAIILEDHDETGEEMTNNAGLHWQKEHEPNIGRDLSPEVAARSIRFRMTASRPCVTWKSEASNGAFLIGPAMLWTSERFSCLPIPFAPRSGGIREDLPEGCEEDFGWVTKQEAQQIADRRADGVLVEF